jgi:hypothetical protein
VEERVWMWMVVTVLALAVLACVGAMLAYEAWRLVTDADAKVAAPDEPKEVLETPAHIHQRAFAPRSGHGHGGFVPGSVDIDEEEDEADMETVMAFPADYLRPKPGHEDDSETVLVRAEDYLNEGSLLDD